MQTGAWTMLKGQIRSWLAKAGDGALQGRLIAISVISWMAIISGLVAIVRLWA